MVDNRLRFEHPVADRERYKQVVIQHDPELFAQFTCERRIEKRLALELEFEVTTVPTDREWAQQHRCVKFITVRAPRRQSDGQVHRLDAPNRPQFDTALGDFGCRDTGVSKCKLVTDTALEQSLLARNKLPQNTG